MRLALTAIVLEVYAVILAWMTALGGVRTDEAKYLLNIPYPHPPLVRKILSWTEMIPFQEMLWRVIFATLMVQAVWIVYDMARVLKPRARITLSIFWLFSVALIHQAGSIMMAPLTALQGLIFLWLYLRIKPSAAFAGWIGVLWLISLMTAYQAVLFGPIVLAILWQMRLSLWKIGIVLGSPLAVLAIYSLSNPLSIASMVSVGSGETSAPLLASIKQHVHLWAMAGSFVLSVLGTVGILLSRRWMLILTFTLIVIYIFLSPRTYYAILFLPLFVAGVAARPWVLWKPRAVCVLGIIASAFLLWRFPMELEHNGVRATAFYLEEKEGILTVNGSFGHEWQYESPLPVYRSNPTSMKEATAVVCIDSCELPSPFVLVDQSPITLYFQTP